MTAVEVYLRVQEDDPLGSDVHVNAICLMCPVLLHFLRLWLEHVAPASQAHNTEIILCRNRNVYDDDYIFMLSVQMKY